MVIQAMLSPQTFLALAEAKGNKWHSYFLTQQTKQNCYAYHHGKDETCTHGNLLMAKEMYEVAK